MPASLAAFRRLPTRTYTPPNCPRMSETPALRVATFNHFNNLTPFTRGKSGQRAPNRAKSKLFTANRGLVRDVASQSRTTLVSGLAAIVQPSRRISEPIQHLAKGFAAVAVRPFFSRRELGECAVRFGEEKIRIVAEAVGALGFVLDKAFGF